LHARNNKPVTVEIKQNNSEECYSSKSFQSKVSIFAKKVRKFI
jgi:hypothetical protein